MKFFALAILAIVTFLFFSGNRGDADALAAASVETARLMTEDIEASKHVDSIVLGAGCFWGAEKRYAAIPGVVDAISGYAGGKGVAPDYYEISSRYNKNNPNNHAEVVKVIFNRSVVSLEDILKNYFEGHDPTQLNRQGNDVGTQYRSIILTNSDEQIAVAQKVMAEYQSLLADAGYGRITTQIQPLPEFYAAEEFHQDYLVKNPYGYCPDHSTGVVFNGGRIAAPAVDNSPLLSGKHVVVVESDHCPFCEKLKKDVLNDYQGSIPLTYRQASQLEDLEINTPTWATPTILFLNDGREVFGKMGYMKADEFYHALERFQQG